MQTSRFDVAIVGAGPYGLSLATHLKHTDVRFRIFGQPMQAWRDMPRGMFLKSFGFATNVYTPDRSHDFVGYSIDRGLEPVEPCVIADFARYGQWVQKALVPDIDETNVERVERTSDGFLLTLQDGRTVRAKQVVIAVGVNHFAHMPTVLKSLPAQLASHTSQHRDYGVYAGRDVCIVGAGQSAFEAARLLQESGARPRLLVRANEISFSSRMTPHRSLWQRIRRPSSGLGPGLKNWVLETFPGFLHFIPDRWRVPFVNEHLGPQGAWWLVDRIVGKVPVLTNTEIVSAEPRGDRLALTVRTAGESVEVSCDHVVAATGYVVDVERMAFLEPKLRGDLIRVAGALAPALDAQFQSSVPGLYFVGFASSASFGPLFRFVAGAKYTAARLSRTLARRPQRQLAPAQQPQEAGVR